jgi:hypothetical protein
LPASSSRALRARSARSHSNACRRSRAASAPGPRPASAAEQAA